MSIHIGLHGTMLTRMNRNLIKNKYYSKHWIVVLRVIVILIAGYGIYAFVEHDFLSYVFLVKKFVFFDFEQPIFNVFIDYLAIMGLWIFTAHYIAKLIKNC